MEKRLIQNGWRDCFLSLSLALCLKIQQNVSTRSSKYVIVYLRSDYTTEESLSSREVKISWNKNYSILLICSVLALMQPPNKERKSIVTRNMLKLHAHLYHSDSLFTPRHVRLDRTLPGHVPSVRPSVCFVTFKRSSVKDSEIQLSSDLSVFHSNLELRQVRKCFASQIL